MFFFKRILALINKSMRYVFNCVQICPVSKACSYAQKHFLYCFIISAFTTSVHLAMAMRSVIPNFIIYCFIPSTYNLIQIKFLLFCSWELLLPCHMMMMMIWHYLLMTWQTRWLRFLITLGNYIFIYSLLNKLMTDC